jgi:hypothetical protein
MKNMMENKDMVWVNLNDYLELIDIKKEASKGKMLIDYVENDGGYMFKKYIYRTENETIDLLIKDKKALSKENERLKSGVDFYKSQTESLKMEIDRIKDKSFREFRKWKSLNK